MGEPRKLKTVRFYCRACRNTYDTAPDTVVDEADPAEAYHPWRYQSACPRCSEIADQDGRERGRLKAAFNGNTGPKTEAGKAAVTANLEGHPTPEETEITKLNGLKHGLYAKVATYFPAKPGKYPHCSQCQHYSKHGDDAEGQCVEFPASSHENAPWCLLRTELFMKHRQAFDSGDPKQLLTLNADRQAMISAITDDMGLAIIADGVRSETPEWYSDKEGGFHLAEYFDEETQKMIRIMKREAHPLLNYFINFVQKNNMTLADLGMTPKVQDENDILSGNVTQGEQDREAEDEVRRKQLEMMDLLKTQLSNASQNAAKDPVLIEHQQEGNG